MNEFPRLRARVEAAEQKVDLMTAHIERIESVVVRLAEQVNQMQQKRKPGPKPKHAD